MSGECDTTIVTLSQAELVMQDVAGNSEAIVLDRLSPGTQYSITVTAIWMGKKYRSRQIVFRTLDLPKPLSQQDLLANGMVFTPSTGVGFGGNPNNGRPPGISNGSETSGDDDAGITSTVTNTLSHGTHRELPTIRGVEIGIVLIVLMVWAGAIALFFNRWGKIRMLLPYQPDYKHEQLKVPGTGVCSGGVCNGQHSHQCLPRCEGCGIFDRCFQYPRRELERDCGCQFALLHRADQPTRVDGGNTSSESYKRVESIESPVSGGSGIRRTTYSGVDEHDFRAMRSNSHMTLSEPTLEVEERESLLDCDVKHHCEHHCRPVHIQKEKCDFHRQLRQKSYAAQRSILKNSQDNAANEGDDLFEAKKQLILRRRRLFSHYRQYEQWRRRQFSYDYCYHRPLAPAPTSLLPLHKTICPNYLNSLSSTNPNAFRRRRLYRRQFSYAERSRDDSHDSKDSYHLPKCHSMAASDTIRTDSTTLNHTNLTTERHSVSFTFFYLTSH
uniref:Fibronectin type III domain-containing protein n=1 Tax=Glossina palpalis gambiensis TaxID=67801 RepID=A0A1B0BGE4_9MUSC